MTEPRLNAIARWLGPCLLLVLIGGYVAIEAWETFR